MTNDNTKYTQCPARNKQVGIEKWSPHHLTPTCSFSVAPPSPQSQRLILPVSTSRVTLRFLSSLLPLFQVSQAVGTGLVICRICCKKGTADQQVLYIQTHFSLRLRVNKHLGGAVVNSEELELRGTRSELVSTENGAEKK